MTGDERAQLDEQLRAPIRAALAAGADAQDIVYLLTRMLPELVDRRNAHGHIQAAYDLYQLERPELDSALPFETGPFDRIDRD